VKLLAGIRAEVLAVSVLGKRRKRLSAALLFLFVATAGLLAGTGSAAAAPPIVVGSCAASIQGTPGQPVSLSPTAVISVVTDAVRAVPLLGPPLAGTIQQTFAALPPIPLGAVPNGTGYVSGGSIAAAVNAQLNQIPLLGPIISAVVGTVQSTLTSICGITVTGVNAVAAPVQDSTKAVADASEQAVANAADAAAAVTPGAGGSPDTTPGTGGNPTTGGSGGKGETMPAPNQTPVGGVQSGGVPLYSADWTFGRSPMADYSSIPFAKAGFFSPSPGVRYGGSVPGYSPEFGIVGDTPQDDGGSVAGRAEALSPPPSQRVEFPVLLAVLALSCVTAALVRTWVLRRAPSAAM
jgi:hypothetical protein